MFEGVFEMNEHLGHAGSGVGRGEWHFGHRPRPTVDVVDNVPRSAADRSVARMNDVGSWWDLNDIER